jgi:hypothetical protein
MLLALAIAAGAAAPPKPPANVIIPKELKERREKELSAAPEGLPLFANPLLAAALGPFDAHRGAWVEYLVRNKGQPDTRVRASILDQPAGDGRYWLELDTASQEGMAAAAKLLVHGNPLTPRDVERMFVMMAGQQPLEVPLDQADVSDEKPPAPPKVTHEKPEQITVRAGTYKADVLRAGDTRIWHTGKVPLWGLVKVRSPRQSLELIGAAQSGAHTIFPPGWGDEKDQGMGKEMTKS